MSDLLLWQERQIKEMRQEVNNIFESICRDFSTPNIPYITHSNFHIQEKNDTIIVWSELRYLDASELQLTASNDVLQVRGVRHRDIVWQDGGLSRGTAFSINIKLPGKVDPDHTRATFVNNILKIVMPKFQRNVMKRIAVDTE